MYTKPLENIMYENFPKEESAIISFDTLYLQFDFQKVYLNAVFPSLAKL